MKKIAVLLVLNGLFLGCQTESLDIQRTFPFSLQLDAFPAAIPLYEPTRVGFGIRPTYVTVGNVYSFSWQVAAPSRGVLTLDSKVVNKGQKVILQPTMSALLSDSITYMPIDSGQHELTLQVVDGMGQKRDTTITLTAVR